MESLRANYRDEEEEDDESSNNNSNGLDIINQNQPQPTTETTLILTENDLNSPEQEIKQEPDISEEISEGDLSEDDNNDETQIQKQQLSSEKHTTTVSDDEEDENTPKKKQKFLASFEPDQTPPSQTTTPIPLEEEEDEESKKSMEKIPPTTTLKKPKKKPINVWTKPASRKGKKKNKLNNGNGHNNNNGHHHNVASAAAASAAAEDTVLITPIPRFPDRTDDTPDMKICLSKVYKAEKVELSDDRLSAGSSKGYRMVRATRGVVEGAWYFEIRVVKLGESGHTRLGWSTEKGDLQAPVGYDGNSFGYRDVDGSKVHKAVREKYGEEGYAEGDVIGFYINLPEGGSYAPKPVHLFWYKGQKYSSTLDAKEESAKVVPGSEICFFRNGVFQGVAFKDLCGGRYYPAASMYTLPNQPNCVVKFNFGPDFEFFPRELEDRPIPTPMIEIPYQGFDGRVENGESVEKKQ